MKELGSLDILQSVSRTRSLHGYMSVQELLALSQSGNIFLDPFSALIGKDVSVGEGNLFYPNVVISAKGGGQAQIGSENSFYPATYILVDRGILAIGNCNQFGEGGFVAKANQLDARIEIGSHCRFVNGPQILGKTDLGDGTQIIGAVTVQNCILEGGLAYDSPDPDERGAVVKGSGLIRDLTVARGMVAAVDGFLKVVIKQQSFFHPKR